MSFSRVNALRLKQRLQEAGLTALQSEEIASTLREAGAFAQPDLARGAEVERLELAIGDGLEALRKDFDFVLNEVVAIARLSRAEAVSAQARFARQMIWTNRLLAVLLVVVVAATGVASTFALGAVRSQLRASSVNDDSRWRAAEKEMQG